MMEDKRISNKIVSSLLLLMLAWLMPLTTLAQNHWVPQSATYEDNMTLTGVIMINGEEQHSTALEVGAFCGEECRGSMRPVLFPPTQRYVVQMTIYGNEGEQITFKLFDHDQGEELNLQSPDAITFGSTGLGSLMNPYVLDFMPIVTISATIDPDDGGNVSGMGSYSMGNTCTLVATPNVGYTFMYWTENGNQVSTNANYSFIVTADRHLVAHFTLPLTITAISNPVEGGMVAGMGVYDYNTSCTLTATANEGFTFSNWTKDGTVVSAAATFSFIVTESSTYVANFTDASGTGVLNGVFSIGENSHYNFSQGNLQYQASTNTWRFATNQWDCVGNNNTNISQTYSGWVDLFGWGTSGYNHGAVCYQPWSISNSYSDYYAYGVATNNLYDQTGQADWGYNAIANGGNTENGGWRTLTGSEWSYVFNTRNTESGIRYAKAQVNNVNGVILLPDNWSASTYTLNDTNTSNASFSSNNISASQWTILENAGAVFLPAADDRNGASFYGMGWSGYYWSASSVYGAPHYMRFGGGYIDIDIGTSGYYGFSVRLVRHDENYSYEINAISNPAECGMVTGSGTYEEGVTCTLVATANEGYTFTNWTENGEVVSTEATYSFIVSGDRTLVANFSLLQFDITVSALPDEGGSVTGGGTYQYGQSCTLTAMANEGYTFINWTENGNVVSSNASYTFNVEANRSLVANFSLNSYTIIATANPSNGGTVSGAGNHNYGASCTLTATAASGFTFANWTENGNVVSTEATYSFIVSGDRTLVANFSLLQFDITVSALPDEGGSVTGGGTYQYGQSCTLTAMANEGYAFANWKENGEVVSTDATYSFAVTGDRELVANFAMQSYSISASANPSAGGSVSGAGSYDHGSTCTLTATANEGYSFTNWTENGEVISSEASFSFTVTGERELVANFALQSYTISTSTNPSEGGSVTGSGTYGYGSACTVTATASEGYTFQRWTENGEVVSTEATYSFTVTGDRELVANFAHANGAGTLSGVFSVGENSHVNFSQGNLQYQASTNTWRFAENQWDYVGADNANISETYDGWIDLFGWGTSGYNHGAIGYQPWTISQDNGEYLAYGDGETNLNDQSGQADWGYNAISNGGNQENNGWRTMTQPEWDYLINGRTTASGIRYAKAIVNEVQGIILLPDDWSASIFELSNTNEPHASFNGNEIDLSQWEILENAGAVFLPSAGERISTSINYAGNSGYYWSATRTDVEGAFFTFFYWDYVGTDYGLLYDRSKGRSVRLVKDDQSNQKLSFINDDFNDGEINAGYWTATGPNVYEEEGMIKIQQNVTDNDVRLTSGYISIPGSGKILIDRKFLVHRANNYFSGGYYIAFNGDEQNYIRIAYWHEAYIGKYGIYIDAQLNGITTEIRLCDAVFDTWHNEAVLIDVTSGTLAYCIDNNLVATNEIPGLSDMPQSYFHVWFYPYGWWTGHYQNMDFIKINVTEPSCHITVSSSLDEGGTVTGEGNYNYGDVCTLTAVPNDGYEFYYWSENGDVFSTEANASFIVTSGHDLVGVFGLPLNVTATASPSEGGAVYGAGEYNYGSTCTLTAAANEGYTFMYWTENGNQVSADATYSFTVTDNRELVAHFALPFAITATASPTQGGSINGIGEYDYGSTCTLTAIANDCYSFMGWTENGNLVSTNAEYSFTVTSDHDLVANYTDKSLLTVYDGTENNGFVPVYGYYCDAYLKCETVYPMGQIGEMNGGVIVGLKYYATQTDVSWGNASFRVFLKEVDGSSISSFTGSEDATIVYEGSLNISGGVMDVVFTTPYQYNGGNLLIGFYNVNKGGYVKSSWFGESVEGASVQGYSYNGLDAINPTQRNFIPKTMFLYYPDGYASTYSINASVDPSNGGSVSGVGTYDRCTNCTLTATPDEGYVFVNWMENGEMVSTESEYSFTVTGDRELVANFDVPSVGDYVDLGLPSGTLWSTCNLGAQTPESFGEYYAWGETQPKDVYNWSTYQHCMGSGYDLTKYCNEPYFGYNDFADYLSVLLPEDDAAVVNWGTDWLMPTKEDWQELLDNTTNTWTIQKGVKGRLFTASNGNSLFLPTPGYRSGDELGEEGNYGCYWSSSVNTDLFSVVAWDLRFYSDTCGIFSDIRSYGFSIRPVHSPIYLVAASVNPEEGGFVEGAGNYVIGSTCTLTATPNVGYVFRNWTENGEVISAEAAYSFAVTGDRNLVANFVPMLSSISDDFNDGIINPEYWTATGPDIYEEEGLIKIQQNVTDYYVALETLPLSIPIDNKVIVDRQFYLHEALHYWNAGDRYFYGNVNFKFNGSDDNYIGICYYDDDWENRHGTYIRTQINGEISETRICDVVFDTWLTETIVLDMEDNTLTYCRDNGTIFTIDIPSISLDYLTVRFKPDGWWTGHYHNMDYININANVSNRMIVVSTNLNEAGVITGAGEHEYGSVCTLTATPNEGYEFQYWTENGETISTEPSYSFIVMADRSLVAHFVPTRQIFSFSPGWSWLSTYVEQDDIDGLSMLEEGLAENGIMIKSQYDGFVSYNAGSWMGTLDGITNEKMYLINTSTPADVVITGPAARLSEHPITLNPNWNWISYPSPFERDINEALANLNATEGDVLKSQSCFAIYNTIYGWYGSLNTMTPGMGFMYQSHNNEDVTFVYSEGMSRSLKSNADIGNNHWMHTIEAYPQNMSMIAVVELNGEEVGGERYELAVFSGEECRGSVRLVYVEPLHRHVAFLSVMGEEVVDLSLALYDTQTGKAYFNPTDGLRFVANAVLGTPDSPYVARFGGMGVVENDAESIAFYPNPVRAGQLFQIKMPVECPGVRVSIVNALGTVVSTTDLYAHPATLRAPAVAGVYLLRMVTNKGVAYCRKLVVKN